MAKGFSPLIGLAVVMALALAAVFGSMSLANPAAAQTDYVTISAVGGDAKLTVNWDVPSTVPDTARWEIWYRDSDAGGSFTRIPSAATNRATNAQIGITSDSRKAEGVLNGTGGTFDTTLSNGVTYEVRVAAFEGATDASSRLGTSNIVTAKTIAAPAGTIEISAKGVIGGVNLTYGFDSSGQTGGGEVTRWEYEARTACVVANPGTGDTIDTNCDENADTDVVAWADVDGWKPLSNKDKAGGTTMVSEGLMVGTVYQFRVRPVAVNSESTTPGETHADSNTSSIAGASPLALPAGPTGLRAVAGDLRATLSWDKRVGTHTVTKNQYRFSTDAGATWPNTWTDMPGPASTRTSYDVTGLTNDTAHLFQVRSVIVMGDDDVATAHTETPTAVTPTAGELMAPQNLVVWIWDQSLRLNWDNPKQSRIAGWEVRYKRSDAAITEWTMWADANETMTSDGERLNARISGLMNDVQYDFELRAVDAKGTPEDSTDDITGPVGQISEAPFGASLLPHGDEPGDNVRYDIKFLVKEDMNTLTDELVIKLEDFGMPASGMIGTNSVAITVDQNQDGDLEDGRDRTTIAEDVSVSGSKVLITIGDLNKDRTGVGGVGQPSGEFADFDIEDHAFVTVSLRQSAGITNPTKAKAYGPVISVNSASSSTPRFKYDWEAKFGTTDSAAYPALTLNVPRIVKLGSEDGGLGDEVTATGSGFEKGVTLHFFLDSNVDGIPTPGKNEDTLCTVPAVGADNVGTCTFTVNTPTFATGDNFVNAFDGKGNVGTYKDSDDQKFELTASISATPAGGSPGEIMQVQLVSFPANVSVNQIKLSGQFICGGKPPDGDEVVSCARYGGASSQGTGSIAVTVPNWAPAGVQELFLMAGGKDDTFNVTIVGPQIMPTPQTVVANQRISLVGTGFSPGAKMGDDTDDAEKNSSMSIGGYKIPWSKVNDGRDVDVDDGGNWSASLDLPMVEATTGSGERVLRVQDSKGRTGAVQLTLAERTFDITPESGRVGTLAVVRGVGYPSKNDEGFSFTVDVTYKVQEGTTTRVSVVPDASGRFEAQLRIPTTASIPSTNQVEVKFTHESPDGTTPGTDIVENKQHFVPEGIIMLSETSGGHGTTVTVNGEGFKSFVPVSQVKIGTIEVTPAPKPSTDANGMMEFDILIPGLEIGIQTIEVQVGGTTASVGFTVSESGVAPGDIMDSAAAVEPLGDNLDVVWHFNNDSKTWSYYDGNEDSTLTHMITGETYLINVMATVEVILNRDTRSLTCVGGNCWNQIVW